MAKGDFDLKDHVGVTNVSRQSRSCDNCDYRGPATDPGNTSVSGRPGTAWFRCINCGDVTPADIATGRLLSFIR